MINARPEPFDYSQFGDVSTLVKHPHDDGIWLGAVGALDALPDEEARTEMTAVLAPANPKNSLHDAIVRLSANKEGVAR
jgi:hypothetical protein